MDSLDLVTRGQEEKLSRVSLNNETLVIDTTDCILSGTTQVEEGLNMGAGQMVEDHILERRGCLVPA